MEEFEDYEPTEEELKDLEKMINEDAEEEAKEFLNNRVYYQHDSFFAFLAWLKKNGIKW